ncbi:MAG: AAA family ATPase [Clostridia bacterium]|nr:AAA family ATPase [Clostridia bacterium]
MKNIITALCNSTVNDKLKEINEFNILANDIQYQEGIFEILENKKEIDYLILSEFLPGEYEIKKLIEKIKEKNNTIKIILILEKEKEELENYLYAKGIFKIFYNNKIEISDIINLIKNNYNENEKIIQELENLKNILIKNNININNGENLINKKEAENHKKIKNKILEKIKLKIERKNKINTKINLNKKVISILGTGGVGKSIATINIANLLKENNYKVLITDFDILNNSLHTLLGVNKYPEKIKNKIKNNTLINNKINIKELIIKINKNIDLISGMNLLFDSKYKISSSKVKNILEELKENYDYIIIDNSAECFFEYTKNIINNSDLNIYLFEANLIEIKKAKNLLEIYNKEWNIEKNKINLLINKYNKHSVRDKIIKNIFSDYKILGKINFNEKYNLLINKNYKQNKLVKKEIKKGYEKIFNI